MQRLSLCLGVLALTACDATKEGIPSSDPIAETDADGDGVPAYYDCDDDNAAIFPGAEETCDGIDNDCNGSIDDNAPGLIRGFADTDGDGFGDRDVPVAACDPAGIVTNRGDCDDSDAAVNPDADEVCDGIDNDCDDAIDGADNNALGLSTYYADADGDGYGGSEEILDCTLPDGATETTGDCDDTNAEVNPDGTEVECDGLDNDCDGVTDVQVVPRDYATIQDAVDQLDDGAEICLAPGTYAEPVFIADKSITVTGGGDPADIVLDISGSEPFFLVDGGVDYTELTLQNLTATGAIVSTDLDGASGGALLQSINAQVYLRDLSFDDISLELLGDGSMGTIVAVADSALDVARVSITDFAVDINVSAGPAWLLGGAFFAVESDLILDEVTMTGTTASVSAANGFLGVGGLLAATHSSSLEASNCSVSDSVINLAGPTPIPVQLDGGLAFEHSDSNVRLSNVSVTDNTVQAAGEEVQLAGLISVLGADSVLNASVVDLSRNDFALDATVFGFHTGVVSGLDGSMRLRYLTAWNNSTTMTGLEPGGSSAASGPIFVDGGAAVAYADIRANTTTGFDTIYGGGLCLSGFEDSISVTNSIVAGNYVDASTQVRGGGIYFAPDETVPSTITNVSVYANTIGSSADSAQGAALYLNTALGETIVSNTAIGDSQLESGPILTAWAAYITDADGLTGWTYNNVHDQTASANLFFGIADPTGDSQGNISADSPYTDVSSSDPTQWDFTPATGSAHIDAGDPDLLDADGSRSDIGAYGGPGSDGW